MTNNISSIITIINLKLSTFGLHIFFDLVGCFVNGMRK